MTLPDIRFLRSFFIVADEGNFGRAAERLHLTQPAVSYRMRRLEEQLGVDLFERAGRRMILTPAGRRLRDFTSRYFPELEDLLAGLTQAEAARREPLRIASVSGFGRYVLFPVLASQRFRHLRFHLTYPVAAEVFDRVERGEVELGFAYATKTSNYLEYDEVYEEELVLVAASDFTDAPGPGAPLSDLEPMPFVTYEESDWVFGQWFETCYGAQPAVTRSVLHFEELEEVVEMVRRGRGLSIVPDHSARAEIEAGTLRILRPTGERCSNTVHSVVRAGAYRREEIGELIDDLRRSCG